MNTFLDIFINQILGQAPLLMGIIVFIGYLTLGRGISGAITGFIKASVGFMILQAGYWWIGNNICANFESLARSIRNRWSSYGFLCSSISCK